MTSADVCLPGVDPDHGNSLTRPDSFAHVTNGRDSRTGPHLYDHEGLLMVLSKESLEAHLLASGPVGKPGEVAKHQDIRSGRPAAMPALGDMLCAHGGKIDRDCLVIDPNGIAAGRETLQMVDRTVNFEDLILAVAGLLELAVDVRGDDETVLVEFRGPILQQLEAAMRFRLPIKVGAMTVEAPAESRVSFKIGWIGRPDEIDAEAFIHRVGVPEPLISTKIGQA